MTSLFTTEQANAAARVHSALAPEALKVPLNPDRLFLRFAAAVVNQMLVYADEAWRRCGEGLGPTLPPPGFVGEETPGDVEDAQAAVAFASQWIGACGDGASGPSRAEAALWFRTRTGVLPAVVTLAGKAGWDQQCWQIAARCYDPLLAEGALAESVTVSAAGLAAAQRCRDPHAVALMHLACGSAATMTGWLDEALAHYDQALPTFQQMGDERGQARTTLGAGAVHQVRRELYAARLCQLAVLETTSIPALTALATGNLGRIALDSGELNEAVRCSTAALRIIDGAGIPALRQVIEVNQDLAETHMTRGNLPEARRHMTAAQSAANAAAEQDMTCTSVHVAVHLTAGRIALAEGQPAEALHEFTRALERRTNTNAHLADLLEGIGQVFAAEGQPTAARAVLHAALSQRRIDGIAYHTAGTMAHLAAAYQDQDDTLANQLRAEAIAQLRPLADAPSVMLRERLATAA